MTVDGSEAVRPAGAWFRPRRRAGRLGVVGVTRLLVFELVLVVAFVVIVQRMWVLVMGAALGVAVLAAAFGRSGGRWWSEWLGLWLRYRRRRGGAGAGQEDPRLAAVRELAPDLAVEEVDGPAGTRIGMGSDGAGWFAVLEVVPPPQDRTRPPVPLTALARIAAEAEQPGVVVQVVSHHERSAGRTHAALWVAVRLDAAAVAESVIGDPGFRVDVPAVLAEVTRRTERALRRRGVSTRTLGTDELLDALATSCGLRVAEDAPRVREAWDAWRVGDLRHGCFWLSSWPDPARGTAMLAALRELPASQVSLALLLEPGDAGTSLRCLVRVAAPGDEFEAACLGAEQAARAWGGELFRLAGEHAPAVYASMPSGGGAR